MSLPAQRDDTDSTPLELPAELLEKFAAMATLVPDESDAGHERILEQLFAARTPEELSEPWESTGAAKLAGKMLRIDSITRRESSFTSGFRIFLVVHSFDLDRGEKAVWTTSSIATVAQLVHAYAAGWFPLYAEIVIADRPTPDGYRPHHLKIHAAPRQS